MDTGRFCQAVLIRFILVVQVALAGLVYAQGIQTSPYSASSMVRGLSGEGLTPPSLFAPPGAAGGSSGTIPITSGMFHGILPPIPNLQFGYLYQFGNNVSAGRGTVDYLLPYSLNKDSVLFGEAHSEFQNFWKPTSSVVPSAFTTTTTSGFNNRVDVSLGGGYRRISGKNTLFGANGFYDASRLGGTWYSSGSLGVQMAALVSGSDAIDLNFNWYGKLFNSSFLVNAFRFGPSNFDFQAGYSHELWNGGPDFRLSATGYQFDVGNRVYGWNAGAELKSRDGMFVLRYNAGNDKVNQTYQTIGAFVNVGFQSENILKGESPFTKPTPIFKSPRNLWYMLTQTVNRDWFQPAAVVAAKSNPILAGGPGGVYTAALPLIPDTKVPSIYYNFVTPSYVFSPTTTPVPLAYTISWSGAPAPVAIVDTDIVLQDPTIPGDITFYIDGSPWTLTAGAGSHTGSFTIIGSGAKGLIDSYEPNVLAFIASANPFPVGGGGPDNNN